MLTKGRKEVSKIRTAVVGLRMGAAHAKSYHRSENADLRWVCDLDEQLAAEMAEELGCQYTTDWESVLDDIDAISICTPHQLHEPQTVKALSAGKHVLVEKPMANTERECLSMIHASEQYGKKLMVAYPLRYLPSYTRLKEAINKKEFGEVISLNGFVHGFLTPRPGSWFSRKEDLGGGVLFSHGSHDIDIMVWLMGEPRRVAAFGTRIGTDWMEGEGTAHAIMEFGDGSVGNLSVTWGFPHKNIPSRLQVHTTEALLQVTSKGLEVVDKDGKRIVPGSEPEPGRITVSYEVEHFLSSIINDTQPMTDGHDVLKGLRVIWDMYEFNEAQSVG